MSFRIHKSPQRRRAKEFLNRNNSQNSYGIKLAKILDNISISKNSPSKDHSTPTVEKNFSLSSIKNNLKTKFAMMISNLKIIHEKKEKKFNDLLHFKVRQQINPKYKLFAITKNKYYSNNYCTTNPVIAHRKSDQIILSEIKRNNPMEIEKLYQIKFPRMKTIDN